MNRLQAMADSMGVTPHKVYLKKRLEFIKWARDERYTLQEIGKVIDGTKHTVYKILKDEKLIKRK